jgi:hypothetical protein
LATFVIKNEDAIEFRAFIDEDGDFSVSANGVPLLYIGKNTGELYRYYTENYDGVIPDGIASDDDGRIVIDCD